MTKVYANYRCSNLNLFTLLDEKKGGLHSVLLAHYHQGKRIVTLRNGTTFYLTAEGEHHTNPDFEVVEAK